MLGELSGFWWVLLALGFVGGIFSGTFGVGSGIIFIPALVLILSLPQHSAQGTALAVMVPMALLGAFRYWKDPTIDVRRERFSQPGARHTASADSKFTQICENSIEKG